MILQKAIKIIEQSHKLKTGHQVPEVSQTDLIQAMDVIIKYFQEKDA